MEHSDHKKKLVVKFGTENLCGKRGALDESVFAGYARQIVKAESLGFRTVIVSSGGIKAGREHLKELRIDDAQFKKKELAGIGARHLLNRWGEAFSFFRREVGQVWVTFANWRDEAERKSIKASIERYLDLGIIPIVNENDVISDTEIRLMEQGISENDRLARMIAELIGSDAVLFLTNVQGVYTGDPTKDPHALRYAEIDAGAWVTRAERLGGASENGTGGMRKKIQEACKCAGQGMRTAIAGTTRNVIYDFANERPVGTTLGTKDVPA